MTNFSPYDWTGADMIGGNPAIDFTNTASEWSSEPLDRLGGADGFAKWVKVAGLLDDEHQKILEREIADDPKAAARFFDDAMALRAALYRIFYATESGCNVEAADLTLLNDWRARSSRHCKIRQEGGVFRRGCSEEAPAQERAMRIIVDAAEDLLLNGRLDRLRSCGGENCEWMFLDLSKSGRRRWCSMATCGNDHKVKQYRKRKKAAA